MTFGSFNGYKLKIEMENYGGYQRGDADGAVKGKGVQMCGDGR